MSLPIITLPHVITPSLALSVLSDLLPRLTHSSPAIRKKTIVTLYRLYTRKLYDQHGLK